jgi:leader peptidase (prepilin peptidase)/N-methyltransferase
MTDAFVPPDTVLRVLAAAFGLIIGSFLNVVVHRVPRGESVVTPRSRCPSCGRLIRWYENVPVLSFVFLRARCAGCSSRISWRYPALEAATGLLFLLAFERFGPTLALPTSWLFIALMIALAGIDAEHFLLPDAITLPFVVVGLGIALAEPIVPVEDALLGVLVAFATLEALNLAYKLVRGRDGFGGGDTKMLMLMGAFLGFQQMLLALVVASVAGVVVGIPAAAVQRRRRIVARGARESQEPAAEEEVLPEEPRPRLRELLPRTLGEALPLLLVPAISATWLFEGGSPRRTAMALVAAGAACLVVDRLLAKRARVSPALALLLLAASVAGWPVGIPLLAGIAGIVVLVVLARPPLVAPRPAPLAEEKAPPDDAPLSQAELPFGVFLAIGGIVAMLAGGTIVDWYLAQSASLWGGADA